MGIKRGVVCTVCGLVACVCANAGTAVEPARQHQSQPAVIREVDALPADDHDHREFNATVRDEDANLTAGGTSSDAPPPGTFINPGNMVPIYHYRDDSAWFYAQRPQPIAAIAAAMKKNDPAVLMAGVNATRLQAG